MKPAPTSALLTAAILAASSLSLPSLHAATVSFNEGTTNNANWTTAADWFTANPNGTPTAVAAAVPVAGDTADVGYQSGTVTSMNYNVLTASAPQLAVLNVSANTSTLFILSQDTAGTLLKATTENVGTTNFGAVYDLLNGTNTVTTLNIGTTTGNTAKYHVGAGTTAILNATNINVGLAPAGVNPINQFLQDGGSVNVSTNLTIGTTGGSGCYTLNNGSLTTQQILVGLNGTGTFIQTSGNITSTSTEEVGFNGIGTFTQSGGNNNLGAGVLTLGVNTGDNGTYSLSSTATLTDSVEDLGDQGTGTFNQTGGTHTVSLGINMAVNSGGHGVYSLSAGSLFTSEIDITSNPTAVGNFIHSGGNVTASDIVIAALGTGCYALSGTGNLSLSGNLTLTEIAGGNATFLQTGGTATIGDTLILGNDHTTIANFTLANGSFNAATEDIGMANDSASTASFTQSGGSNTVTTNSLIIANLPNSTGTYTLAAGTLSAPNIYLGLSDGAVGFFTQTGGSVTVASSLDIGTAGTGTYSLAGSGALSFTSAIYVGLNGGTGTFTQSGGNVSSSAGGLEIAVQGTGTYNLSGGNLSVSHIDIALGATGTFNQSGGILTTTGPIIIGSTSDQNSPSGSGIGIYNLSNVGTINANTEDIGNFNGVGTFNQSAGTNNITGTGLFIRPNSFYIFSNGSLSVTNTFLNSGTFSQTGGVEFGRLQNAGTFNYTNGTFTGTFENESNGTLNLIATQTANSGVFAPLAGILNLGSITIPNNTSIGASFISTVDNENLITLAGGAISTTGPILNNATITGYGNISLSSAFTNNGSLIQGAGLLTISANIINNGSILLAAGRTLQLTAPSFTNNASLSLSAAVITGNTTLANAAGGTLLGPGTITVPLTNSGTIQPGAGTLNILTPWTNSGLLLLNNSLSSLSGSPITNNSTIQGFGSIGAPITNSGTIEPIGGTLTLAAAITNPIGGTLNASNTNKLLLTAGLPTNAGLISLAGGIFDTNNHPLNNTGQITGYGTLRSGLITNNNILTFTGSNGATTTINADILNNPAKTLNIKFNPAIFTGNVTNNGIIKTTSTTATFAATFTNNGAFLSDPSTNIFQSTTTNAGSMSGSSGDAFYFFSGSFANSGSFTNGGILSSADNITNTGTFSQSGPQTWSNNTTFTNNAGAASFATDTGTPTSFPLSFLINSGVVTFTANQHLQSLKITDATAPRLNLTNTKIIVEDTAASRLSDIQALRNQAVTNNLGIYSSTAQAANTLAGKTIFAVAVVNNAVRIATFPSGSTNFGATNNVDSNSILLTATYKGDANLDGVVDIQDLTDVANHWQQSVTDWSQGDFDNSNFVDIQDLTSIANNWQAGVAAGGGQSFNEALAQIGNFKTATSTPEPASLSLLCLGSAALMIRRRNKQ